LANRRLREAQRAHLLQAAHRVFARRGAAGTMAEIAEEAKVSQGLAYRYFPSKEAILRRLVRGLSDQGGGFSARVGAIPGTPGERLRSLVTGMLTAHREQAEFFQLVYQFNADPAMPRAYRAELSKRRRTIEGAIRTLIVQGQSTGEVADGDPDQLVEALLSLIEGRLRRASRMAPEEARRRFPEPAIVLRLLLRGPPPPLPRGRPPRRRPRPRESPS
jgi:AcrR family transcriptional regulator